MNKEFKNLKFFNLFMAVFHGLQSILILIISKDFKLPITVNFLNFDKVS